MKMRVYFPGKKKVYAEFQGFTIQTDQPVRQGGAGSAPSPFELFLASLGTCAGYYVAAFCQQRGIDYAAIEIEQYMDFNPQSHMLEQVTIDIRLPKNFPEKYRSAVVQAAQLCMVKKHLEKPPQIEVLTSLQENS